MEDEVGGGLIKRLSFPKQLFDARFRILGLQQRPRSIVARAAVDLVAVRPKIKNQPSILKQPTRIRIQYCATAGGQHDSASLTQFIEQDRFATSETVFALDGEDRGNEHAAASLELAIGVDELIPKGLSEQAADGGFAGRHHADQKDGPLRKVHLRSVRECAAQKKGPRSAATLQSEELNASQR